MRHDEITTLRSGAPCPAQSSWRSQSHGTGSVGTSPEASPITTRSFASGRQACAGNSSVMARKLGREAGDHRMVCDSSDRTLLRLLMAWKSERYPRTNHVDRFDRRWVVALLEELHATRSEGIATSRTWAGATYRVRGSYPSGADATRIRRRTRRSPAFPGREGRPVRSASQGRGGDGQQARVACGGTGRDRRPPRRPAGAVPRLGPLPRPQHPQRIPAQDHPRTPADVSLAKQAKSAFAQVVAARATQMFRT